MLKAIRYIAALSLVAVLLFCIFGFAATFEPMDRSAQLIWRWIYGLAGVLSILGTLWLVWRNKND